MASELFLSIVIPCFNESSRLPASLKKIGSFVAANNLRVEVLVVDDGSIDDTAHVAEEALKIFPENKVIRFPKNKGKGAAVKAGMLAAQGDVRLFTDADLSTPIEEVLRLLPHVKSEQNPEGAGGVIGSRRLEGAQVLVDQRLHRRISGFVFRWLVKILVIAGYKDTQCGFKLFTKEAAEQIFKVLILPGFSFDVEVLFRARKLGIPVKELPVIWRDSPLSRVNVGMDSLKMFLDLFRIRFGI